MWIQEIIMVIVHRTPLGLLAIGSRIRPSTAMTLFTVPNVTFQRHRRCTDHHSAIFLLELKAVYSRLIS